MRDGAPEARRLGKMDLVKRTRQTYMRSSRMPNAHASS